MSSLLLATHHGHRGRGFKNAGLASFSGQSPLVAMRDMSSYSLSSSSSSSSFSSFSLSSSISRPGHRRRTPKSTLSMHSMCIWPLILVLATFLQPSLAAFIPFSNCLSSSVIQSRNPQLLQFVPLFVDARFEKVEGRHNLTVTVYGNVTGQAVEGAYPPPTDPSWTDATNPFGKITDSTVNYTTLFTTVNFLTYEPYDAKPSRFCNSTLNGTCPWAPLFYKNASDPYSLHAFSINNAFPGSYSFATLAATLKIQSGNQGAAALACIVASLTPDLGRSLSAALTYLPATILALVGIATLVVSKFSPSSSSDFFYWSSNYGRDQDTLRLVTPGFGDCLQYIQFIVLAGALSLNYPGYYQPVVSRAGWSTLTFNESFVSHRNGSRSLVDGIYVTNGTYGLSRLGQLVGMSTNQDIWAGMVVWLCVIIVCVVIMCQIGFAASWYTRHRNESPREDLRSKNFPFTAGNIVRILYNYFLLPIVSLSLFQLVIAYRSPTAVVTLAVLLLIAIVFFAAWMFFLIFTTKPRIHLFDHLPLLLLYGPLYNTYSDEAAPFAFIPVLLNFMRGIAIGAVQPSGIAQIVILAICEVILILTLHAFRPFQALTSMNAYHTSFSVVRLITILLSIAFVPSLDVAESARGWIGYVMLLMHGMVLVFGFFLNALQTFIEVFARLAGAGESEGGLSKVFGMRQLSKRVRRRDGHDSLTSDAVILASERDSKAHGMSSRSRSASGGSKRIASAIVQSVDRGSQNFDRYSQGESMSLRSGTSPGASTPGGVQSPFSFIAAGAGAGNMQARRSVGHPTDPYYRPPRQKRPFDPLNQGGFILSEGSEDSNNQLDVPMQHVGLGGSADNVSSVSTQRNSVVRSFRDPRDESESNFGEFKHKEASYYTSRESDFYYGVRGPALSATNSRRRVTGPADPMSPVESATGWFKNMFSGKRKDKGKGFEVVRSTPLHLLPTEEEDETVAAEPYLDSPERAKPTTDRGIVEMNRVGRQSEALGVEAPTLRPISIASDFNLLTKPDDKTGEDIQSATDATSKLQARNPLVDRSAASVPRQASFRVPGAAASASDDADRRVPFGSEPAVPSRDRSAVHSMTSSIYPPSEEAMEFRQSSYAEPRYDALAPPPTSRYQQEEERPLSTGRVVHHLASDSIHRGFYDPNTHLGSSAEVVDPTKEAENKYR